MALSKITPESINLASDFAGMGFGGTGAANQLDDYEVGTWTPVSLNATTATYTLQSGEYVKVGSLVYIQGRMNLSSLGDGSANRIGGLPFSEDQEATINVSKITNCPTNFYSFGLRVAAASLFAHVQQSLDGGLGINVNYLANSTQIQFSGTYKLA